MTTTGYRRGIKLILRSVKNGDQCLIPRFKTFLKLVPITELPPGLLECTLYSISLVPITELPPGCWNVLSTQYPYSSYYRTPPGLLECTLYSISLGQCKTHNEL